MGEMDKVQDVARSSRAKVPALEAEVDQLRQDLQAERVDAAELRGELRLVKEALRALTAALTNTED